MRKPFTEKNEGKRLRIFWITLILLCFIQILIYSQITNKIWRTYTNEQYLSEDSGSASMTFVPTEILQIPWGNGDKEVGLFKGPGVNYGPRSFVVNDEMEKIYILDSVNHRIVIYDDAGNLLCITPIEGTADDLCLGDKDTVYLLYTSKNEVVKYDTQGIIIAKYPIMDTKKPVVGIHFDTNWGLFFETADEVLYPLQKNGVSLGIEAQSKKKILGLRGKRNLNYFFLEKRDNTKGIIKVLDAHGKQKTEISVYPKNRIDCLYFIGTDLYENIYIVVEEETFNDMKVKRNLRKYDLKGHFLAQADISYSNYVYTFRDLRVISSGVVYQILPLKEHFKIIKWTADFDKPWLSDKLLEELEEPFFFRISPYETSNPGDITNKEQVQAESILLSQITRDEIISSVTSHFIRRIKSF